MLQLLKLTLGNLVYLYAHAHRFITAIYGLFLICFIAALLEPNIFIFPRIFLFSRKKRFFVCFHLLITISSHVGDQADLKQPEIRLSLPPRVLGLKVCSPMPNKIEHL